MTYRSERREMEDYGFARVRDLAFEAVRKLWRKREAEGWTQAYLAERMGRDPAWISRKLSAPGNWTLRTFGAFIEALDGEAEILLHDLNAPNLLGSNFDAYLALALDRQSANWVNSPLQIASGIETAASNSAPVPAIVD